MRREARRGQRVHLLFSWAAQHWGWKIQEQAGVSRRSGFSDPTHSVGVDAVGGARDIAMNAEHGNAKKRIVPEVNTRVEWDAVSERALELDDTAAWPRRCPGIPVVDLRPASWS